MNNLAILPSVDYMLNRDETRKLLDRFSRTIIKQQVVKILDGLRQGPHSFTNRQDCVAFILDQIKLNLDSGPSLKKVVNATGIVMHTGMGRAPLSAAAQQQLTSILNGYCNIEIDPETGKRGLRTHHVSGLLCRLTGAEDAVVVNNNAAAVFLVLNSLAFGQEAVISRGELVEIGGSFRMPDVMEKSGALMKEIGTTNKTKITDYESAVNSRTGAIVVAHTSNYRVMGFTASPELEQIVRVAHAHSLPVYHDLGGGIIVDLRAYGLPYEPLVQESLAAGVDVVSFSGDKVLGGPQCGIILGKKKYIEQIAKNPIMRAVRCGKLTYAALEATLKHFLHGESLLKHHKVMQLLTLPPEKIKNRVENFIERLPFDTKDRWHITGEKCFGQAGSGTLPLERLESYAVTLTAGHVERIYKKLLSNDPPVMGYISREKLYLDFRTVDDADLDVISHALAGILTEKPI